MKIDINFNEENGEWIAEIDGKKMAHRIHPQMLPPMLQGGRYHAFMNIVTCLAMPLVCEAMNGAHGAADKNGTIDLEKDPI